MRLMNMCIFALSNANCVLILQLYWFFDIQLNNSQSTKSNWSVFVQPTDVRRIIENNTLNTHTRTHTVCVFRITLCHTLILNAVYQFSNNINALRPIQSQNQSESLNCNTPYNGHFEHAIAMQSSSTIG